jgi:hypothetical protein
MDDGSYKELMGQEISKATYSNESLDKMDVNTPPITERGQLVKAEQRLEGSVKLIYYLLYSKSAGGIWFAFLIFLATLAFQVLILILDIASWR